MRCIVCGSESLKPYYNPGPQPLAALNLPRTQLEAANAIRLPMNFHICENCRHVFNVDFKEALVPYSEDNNLMYNKGAGWQEHIDKVIREMQYSLYDAFVETPYTYVDIGAGDGSFLDYLASLDKDDSNSYIAYEPGTGADMHGGGGVKMVKDYFIPQRDIPLTKPSVIFCRHVIEHLEKPREFLFDLAKWSVLNSVQPYLLVEVPCFDKAMATGRIADFLYEHVSNFTWSSLTALFSSAGWTINDIYTAYNDEVLVCGGFPNWNLADDVPDLQSVLAETKAHIHSKLAYYPHLMLWGGTGKGAAFINTFGLEKYRVVDSDINKQGRYVPGGGQIIESPHILSDGFETDILITTRWRAADIYQEIKERQIVARSILVLDNNRLIQYTEEMYEQEKQDAV